MKTKKITNIEINQLEPNDKYVLTISRYIEEDHGVTGLSYWKQVKYRIDNIDTLIKKVTNAIKKMNMIEEEK